MKIWVDADACPGAIKDILFRAAQRTGLQPRRRKIENRMIGPGAAHMSGGIVPRTKGMLHG